MLIIVMGVSGCGKSTIGKQLADHLHIDFFDADDFHPISNITKMKSGEALNDADRKPWLENLAKKLPQWELKGGAVLACSALKESYREILMSQTNTVKWVYLNGNFETITERLSKRTNHFMKMDLLKSQFDTLEPPKHAFYVDINNRPSIIIQQISSKLLSETI